MHCTNGGMLDRVMCSGNQTTHMKVQNMSTDVLMKALDSVEHKLDGYRLDQKEFADRLTSLEQKGVMRGAGNLPTGPGQTLGDLVVKQFENNRELFEKTKQVRFEVKAAGDPITTTSGRMIMSGGIGGIAGTAIGMHRGLTSRPTAATALEYSRYTGVQGAADVQAAEGDSKAAIRPDHTLITQSAITIAGFTKMSRQAMTDAGELRAVVNNTLRRSVEQVLDAKLVNGNTTPAFTGYEPLATAATSLIYTALPDAISEGMSVMQVAGFNPDTVYLNPADWLAITVAKGTSNDHYLSGSYLGALPEAMRGLRVVLSPSVDAGKALLADTSHSEMLIREDFTIEMAYSGDDFTKNLVTILGEMRVIPVMRTVGSMRLITPKAP